MQPAVPAPTQPSAAELGYDPWDPAFVADPYPALARLRTEAPVLFDERTNQWQVSRHADVNGLLRDRRLGRWYRHAASHEEWGRAAPPRDQAALWDLLDLQLIDMEPPDHTRPQRLVTKRHMLLDLPRLGLVEEPRWKPRFVLRGLEAIRVAA